MSAHAPRLRRPLTAVAVAAATLLTGATALPSGSSAAPACRNLTVDAATRAALFKAHDRPRDGQIRKGSIYYGSCGSTKYAIASFSKALADQPEKFRKYPGKPWSDRGDGFEDGCASARAPIPAALVHLWGFCPRG